MQLKINGYFFITISALATLAIIYLAQRSDMIMKPNPYLIELEEFRNNSEARLKADDGWLSVVNLIWITEGEHNIGQNKTDKIQLPRGADNFSAQLKFFNINNKNSFNLKIISSDGASLNGKTVFSGESHDIFSDSNDNPSILKAGSVQFFVIERKNGVAIRIKDANSPARQNFKGRNWYAPNTSFIIAAEWTRYAEAKKFLIPDILGNLNEELSPGFATFIINGKKVVLHPTLEGDKLFFVFRDQTSGKETYGAARFLYADIPQEGQPVTLDFNKAVNPPCAFTRFATCPMPPPENILQVAIQAGEKKPLTELH